MAITREKTTTKNLLDYLPLIGIDDFRFSDNAPDVLGSLAFVSEDVPGQSGHGGRINVQETRAQGLDVL